MCCCAHLQGGGGCEGLEKTGSSGLRAKKAAPLIGVLLSHGRKALLESKEGPAFNWCAAVLTFMVVEDAKAAPPSTAIPACTIERRRVFREQESPPSLGALPSHQQLQWLGVVSAPLETIGDG